jgi:hypothetical protein
MHHRHPAPRGRLQLSQQIGSRLKPRRLLRDIPHHHHHRRRDLPAPALRRLRARARARLGQVLQRAFHQLPELVRVRERLCDQAALLHPAAEHGLAGAELVIDQFRQRDPHIGGAGVQQEDQSVQARLGGGVELQLRIGHLRPIAHWGAVPGAQHSHIHLTALHPVGAQLRRRQIGGGKVSHINNHVPSRGDRSLHRGHIRPARRELPQLGGMRDKHPPPTAETI